MTVSKVLDRSLFETRVFWPYDNDAQKQIKVNQVNWKINDDRNDDEDDDDNNILLL